VTRRWHAVFFDWDGTLVDSAEASYRAYSRLFQSYGIAFDRTVFQATYAPDWYHTYRQLGLPRASWKEADARWVEYYSEQQSALLPGARPLLDGLVAAGLRLGLVTSGDRRRVTSELARFGIERHFSTMVCAAETQRSKPAPDPLRLALECLGAPEQDAVYLGDSPEDVFMARAAGVFAIGIPGGFPNHDSLRQAQPDAWCVDLHEAHRLLLPTRAEG
jgi:HAD superfamily hydrolase (TIGR01549 family)